MSRQSNVVDSFKVGTRSSYQSKALKEFLKKTNSSLITGQIPIAALWTDLDRCIISFLEYHLSPLSSISKENINITFESFSIYFTKIIKTIDLHQLAPRAKDRPTLMGFLFAYCISRFTLPPNVCIQEPASLRNKGINKKNKPSSVFSYFQSNDIKSIAIFLLYCLYESQPTIVPYTVEGVEEHEHKTNKIAKLPIRLTVSEYSIILGFCRRIIQEIQDDSVNKSISNETKAKVNPSILPNISTNVNKADIINVVSKLVKNNLEYQPIEFISLSLISSIPKSLINDSLLTIESKDYIILDKETRNYISDTYKSLQ